MRKTTKRQILQLVFLSCLLIVLSACATPIKKIQISNKFAEKEKLSQLRVAILPLEGKQEAVKFFRKALHVNFMNAGFNVVEKFIVDGVLKKNGWNNPDRFLAIPPQKLGEALGADALLYGNVTKWSKFYAIIHSTLTVGLKLKLVDARTGELLWAGEQLDREFEGVLKIPTGIISIITGPLLFAGEQDNLNDLANKVARNITESLRKPFEIKDEYKMDRKIVIASAEEYIKKIENNSNKEVNPVKKTLADNRFALSGSVASETDDKTSPSLNKSQETKLLSLKTKESANKNYKVSKSDNFYEDEKSGYTMQVGAFQHQNNADKLFEKLKQKGYEVFVALVRAGKRLLYKVQVDHFKNKKDAVQFAKKFQQKEKLSYFITTTKTHSAS